MARSCGALPLLDRRSAGTSARRLLSDSPAVSSSSIQRRPPRRRILVVDDRVADLRIVADALESPSHDVLRASSGGEALRMLLRDHFSVVVLDVLMPDVNGLEVARLMRQRDPTRHTPILFLSASDVDMEFVMKSYRGGPVDFVAKPIDPEVLRARVHALAEVFEHDEMRRARPDEPSLG
jgi:PleD family two-component response regulator